MDFGFFDARFGFDGQSLALPDVTAWQLLALALVLAFVLIAALTGFVLTRRRRERIRQSL